MLVVSCCLLIYPCPFGTKEFHNKMHAFPTNAIQLYIILDSFAEFQNSDTLRRALMHGWSGTTAGPEFGAVVVLCC